MQSCADSSISREAAALLQTVRSQPEGQGLVPAEGVSHSQKAVTEKPVKTGITYNFSHNSRENYWNLSPKAAVTQPVPSLSTSPDLHSCRLASLSFHPHAAKQISGTCPHEPLHSDWLYIWGFPKEKSKAIFAAKTQCNEHTSLLFS